MGRTKPIDWNDLNEEVLETAVRALMSNKRASPDEARDAVNAAAARLIDRKVIPLNPQALLITAATHLLIDERRRRSRYRQVDIVSENRVGDEGYLEPAAWDPPVEDPLEDVFEKAGHNQELQDLRHAFEALSEADRQVLRAYYLDSRQAASMDREAGDRVGRAKMKVFRARNRLRRLVAARKQATASSK